MVDCIKIDISGIVNFWLIKVVGQCGDVIVEVFDVYLLKFQGMVWCQSGIEIYFCVFDIMVCRQVFVCFVDSCFDEQVQVVDFLIM